MRPIALQLAVASLLVVAGIAPAAAGGTAPAPTHDARTDAERPALGAPNVTVWIAPEGTTFADGSEIERATFADASVGETLTRAAVVAENDTLALRVAADGLTDAVAAQSGPNLTARFLAAVEARESFAVSGVQTEASTPPSRLQKELALLDPGTVTVHRTDRDTYWLVYDTERLAAERGDDATEPIPGDGYEFRVETDAGSDAATVRVDERQAVLWASGETTVARAPLSTGNGRTTLAPGTDLTVTVRADGEVVDTAQTTVHRGDDVLFPYSFPLDTDAVESGETLELSVTEGSGTRALSPPLNVTVREPDAEVEVLDARIDPDDDRGVVRVRTNTSVGGFLVVRDASDDGDGILGVGDLPRGESTVTVPFDRGSGSTLVVVAYRDADLDGAFDPEADEPYLASPMATVSDRVELERSTTRTTTPAPTTVPRTTSEPAPPSTSVDRTPDRRVPGFGVGVACLALLAVLALGRRRAP